MRHSLFPAKEEEPGLSLLDKSSEREEKIMRMRFAELVKTRNSCLYSTQ